MPREKITFGKNTEGYLCVWDGKGTMHYVSDKPYEGLEPPQSELNQAKIMVLLFKIARKLKVDRSL